MKLKLSILALASRLHGSFVNSNTIRVCVGKTASALLLTAAFGFQVAEVQAVDLYWDQNGATAGTGGTGNWDLSSSLWRDGSSTGTLGVWSSGNNAILGGTAGTVTLNTTGISATGLDFQTTGYTLAGTATNILTLTGTSPIINVLSAGTATFSTGRIEGTAGFTKTGTGSLVIQSASGVSGAVNVNAGTLSLGTTAGTLTGATSVTVASGAILQLNNTSSNNNNNRLGNIDITLNGGTLNFVGLQAASGTSESINRVVLGSGASTISLASSSGSGAQLGTLTLSNATSGISRSTGATLNFDDDLNGDIISTNLATSNNIIGGWAVYTGTTASWLKSLSGSLRSYGSGDTGYQNATDSTTWLTTGNIDATGTRTTAGRTINSLNITGSGTARVITISSGTLVLASGGLMATGTTGHSLTGGTVTAGTAAGAELFIYNNLSFGIDSVIANNAGGAVNVVKSGAGTLTLSGSTANTFTGTSYINEGTVTMSKTAGINALGGNAIINGGTLNYGSIDNQIGDSATVTLNAGAYNLGARAETIGALTMTGGALARGGATITLSNASSITGGTLNFTSSASSRISTSSTLALGGATFSYDSGTNAGTGTLTLGGNLTYAASNTAATTFSNSAAGVGRLELGSGTRTFDIADSTTLPSATPEVSVNWTVTGIAVLAKSGTGTILLQQSNTFTGGTTVSAGGLSLSGTGSLSTAGSTVTVALTGSATLNNAGSITQTGTARGISNESGTVTLNISNGSGGLIQTASGDSVRVSVSSSNVTLNNTGTITSLNSALAGNQALDFDSVTTGSVSITNNVGGQILSYAADTIRTGANASVTNAGLISATQNTADSAPSADGIDTQTRSGVTVTNTGTISGRHGITGGATTYGITVNNNAGGTITGVNGSGVNIDIVALTSTANVTNAAGATIQGSVAAAFANGDGDGIDIDGLLTLNNSGNIFGYGAKGVGSDTLPNNAQAVSIGGGSITNTSTGQIIGSSLLADAPNGDVTRAGEGILSDNSSGGAAIAVTTVTNSGLIQGKTGAAIRFVGNLADTITNNAGGTIRGAGVGAAIQTGDGSDTINNAGTITGDNGLAIDMQGGNNTLNITGGSASITGDISGGTGGTNSLVIDPGTSNSFTYSGVLSNFASAEIKSGTVTLGGSNTYTGSTAINNGTLRLTTGNDRLPTGTVVSLGQAASTNLGTLDLNGRNQTIAGLVSTSGTNATASNNTVNSVAAATLTLNVAGNHSYGGGTNENSGVITGAISLVKSGVGTQTLGDTNTYSGTTTINGGTLLINGATSSTSTVAVNNTGTLGGNGSVGGNVTVNSGGTLAPGNSIDSLATGNLSFTAGSIFKYELDKSVGASVSGDLTAVTGTLSLTGLVTLNLVELGITGAWDLGSPLGDRFNGADKLTLISYTGAWNNGLFTYLGNVVPDDSAIIFNGQQWWFNYNDTNAGDNFTGELTGTRYVTMTVPEPSTALLGALGLLALLRRRR